MVEKKSEKFYKSGGKKSRFQTSETKFRPFRRTQCSRWRRRRTAAIQPAAGADFFLTLLTFTKRESVNKNTDFPSSKNSAYARR